MSLTVLGIECDGRRTVNSPFHTGLGSTARADASLPRGPSAPWAEAQSRPKEEEHRRKTYENTWKCGELKLYFSPSAGG